MVGLKRASHAKQINKLKRSKQSAKHRTSLLKKVTRKEAKQSGSKASQAHECANETNLWNENKLVEPAKPNNSKQNKQTRLASE